jgi:hypothetical protein
MVFEQILKARFVYKKQYAFLLGLVYTLVGIVSARLIFAASSGLMSVAFTSILLIPSLSQLLKIEAGQALHTTRFSIKRLYHNHSDIFMLYVSMFLGVFVAYSVATLLIPEATLGQLFSQQLRAAGLRGFAVVDAQLLSIVLNNMLIFAVAFVLSFVYGAGAVIFLVWNASVWGVVFSLFVRRAATFAGEDPVVAFAREVVPFLPHMVTEGIAYIGAAIVGGIVSKAVLQKKLFSKRFMVIVKDAFFFLLLGLVLVVIAGIIEVKWFARL